MSSGMKDHDIARLAVCSDLRKNILISLNEGDKSLGDLRERLDISSTTAIHALRDLEKHRLTQQDQERKYCLTNIGHIIALKLMEFQDAADVLQKHERFWLEHDISGIPEYLLQKIGWLKDSNIAESHSTDIFKIYSAFVDLLKNANEIRGLSSMFVPEYTNIIKEIVLNKKVDTKLIVTEQVLDKIGKEALQEIHENMDLKFELFMLKTDTRLAFTVTDTVLSFGLYDRQGVYDWNKDLISYNEKARAWGNQLFDYYAQRSERIL